MIIDLSGICMSDYESQTVTDEASAINIDAGDGCDRALITCEQAAIRFRLDGEDPSTGHRLATGDGILLTDPASIKNFRAVRAADTDAILRISYGI